MSQTFDPAQPLPPTSPAQAPVISSVFGRILTAAQIEEAAINTLYTWFPTYLHEIEKQNGLPPDTLAPPVNYTNRNSFDVTNGEPIPKVVVISPGITAAPQKYSQRMYRATWGLAVGVAMAVRTEELANRYVKAYGAAVRGILSQKRNLDGTIAGIADIVWMDENYPDLPIQDQIMQFRAAEVLFSVDIENVVTSLHGPDQPDDPTYTYGQVENVIIDVIKVPAYDPMPTEN